MYIESVAASLLRQWRGNSGIVEAFAEHDSRPKGFIGMVCVMEFMTILFVRSVILLCRLCPSEYSIIKRAGISAVGSGRIIYVEIKERKFSQKII